MSSALAPAASRQIVAVVGGEGRPLPVTGTALLPKQLVTERFEQTGHLKGFLHHSWSSPQQEPSLLQESKAGAGSRLEAVLLASNNTDGDARSSFAALLP